MLASPPNTISCGYSRIFGDAYSANTQIVPRIIRRAGPQTITCQTATRSVKQRPPTPPLGESARCDGHDAVTFEPVRQNSGERHQRKERGDDSTSALEQFCGGHGGKHNCFMPPADRLELSCRSALIPSFRYKAPRQWRRAPCRR